MLAFLRTQLQELLEQRAALKTDLDAVLKAPGEEKRALTDDEDKAFTEKRDAIKQKDADIQAVQSRIGDVFDAFVTGSSNKGTWARVRTPPIEGKIVRGDRGLDVGDAVSVRLVDVDVERGYIDLERV